MLRIIIRNALICMVLLNFMNLEAINLPSLITLESDMLRTLLTNLEAGAFK